MNEMTRAVKKPFTREYALERLRYDPATGNLTWRERTDSKYPGRWNKRYAGKIAGCVTQVGYRYVAVNNVRVPEHRVIWLMVYGTWPEGVVDHINRDPLDNRIENLRLTDKAGNATNSNKVWGASRWRGVIRLNKTDRWQATVLHRGVRHHGGIFRCETAAMFARDKLADKLHGEYAGLNR